MGSYGAFPNLTQDVASGQNAFAEYARTAQIKQNTALEQQQTQQLQDQNQQTKAINQAYAGAFKPDANGKMALDTDGLQQGLATNGHGAAIPKIMQGITDYQKSRVDLQEQQQKLQTASADAMGNLGYALQQAKYDPQLAHTIIQDHLNDPNLAPNHRQQLLQEQQQIAQNPDLIKQLADQWVTQSPAQQQKAIERQKAQAETMKDRFKEVNGSLYDVSGDQPKLITPQGADPAGYVKLVDQVVPPGGQYDALNRRTKQAVQFYVQQGNLKAAQDEIRAAGQQVGSVEKDIAVATNPQIQAGKVEVAKNTAQAKADVASGGRISIPAGATGEAALANLDPVTAAAIRSIGDGKMDFGTFASRSTLAQKKELAAAVAAYNPNFDQNTYAVRGGLERSATSGDMGKNIAQYNTAGEHLKQLSQAADALDNGNMPLLNHLGNSLGYQFGSDQTTNFNVIKNAVAGEVSKVFKGGEATDAEIKAVQAPFESANSPAQLKGAIDNAQRLMNSKRDALQKQYELGLKNKPNFGEGGGTAQTSAQPPAGATHIVQGRDGKKHYTNAAGTVDLGIAQ